MAYTKKINKLYRKKKNAFFSVRKQTNLIARDLRTPKYRQRLLKSKKLYSRKHPPIEQTDEIC